MKKQQKWSGVKLSKKELEDINQNERIEIIGNILTFLFIIVLALLVTAVIFGMIGDSK